jgi:hypothetical protein
MYISVTTDSCGGNQAAMPPLLLERMTHILVVQAQQAAGKFNSSSNLMT